MPQFSLPPSGAEEGFDGDSAEEFPDLFNDDLIHRLASFALSLTQDFLISKTTDVRESNSEFGGDILRLRASRYVVLRILSSCGSDRSEVGMVHGLLRRQAFLYPGEYQ